MKVLEKYKKFFAELAQTDIDDQIAMTHMKEERDRLGISDEDIDAAINELKELKNRK